MADLMTEIPGVKYDIEWKCGDVYVNGKFAGQLCWTPQDVGFALAHYIEEYEKDDENVSDTADLLVEESIRH